MPTAIQCPHCRRMLKLQDADVGKTVRCPSCSGAFAARGENEAAFLSPAVPDFELSPTEPPPSPAIQRKSPLPIERPKEQPRPAVDTGDVYAVHLGEDATVSPREETRRRRRRVSQWEEDGPDLQPHRGVLILVLGFLSLVFACFSPVGWALGGISMTMGATDIRLIDEGSMDRSGRTMTRAGQICGILGVFFSTVLFILHTALYVHSLPRR